MIRTSVESAAKRYNKKVTKITVAAVADIVTDTIFFTHAIIAEKTAINGKVLWWMWHPAFIITIIEKS